MEHIHRPKPAAHHHGVEKAHSHSIRHKASDRKRLLLTIVITGSMMVVEFVAGVVVNSLALVSDAGHMLTHFFALAVSYVTILIAGRPATKNRTFGFYRSAILASLLNGITLLIITAYIFWEGYKRIIAPEPIDKLPMFIVAVAGLVINLVTAYVLSKTDRENLNLKSAFLHMLTDTASSVAIVIGAIVIFYTNWYIIDPLLSLFLGAVILIWSWRLLKSSVDILLEASPKHISPDNVITAIKDNIPEVVNIHDVHIWTITSRMYSMTAHVTVRDISISESQRILDKINRLLDKKFDVQHVNVQFEADKSKPEPELIATTLFP